MLGRREEPARLLVLGSYRPVDVIVTGHPLRSLLQELRARESDGAFNAIDEGLRVANQIGHVHLACILRSEAASLHSEAFDFPSAAAIAREELQRPWLTDRARPSAMFALAFALLGLGRLDEAQPPPRTSRCHGPSRRGYWQRLRSRNPLSSTGFRGERATGVEPAKSSLGSLLGPCGASVFRRR